MPYACDNILTMNTQGIDQIVSSSERILIPKGPHHRHCLMLFEKIFSISVPVFPNRALRAFSGGREFIAVRGWDIPMLLNEGYGDIGLGHTDAFMEQIPNGSMVKYTLLGTSHLKFCILIPIKRRQEILERLYSINSEPLMVVTAYPSILKKHLEQQNTPLNIVISHIIPSGSVEAMVGLGVADIAADVVDSGATAAANHLEVIHLEDVWPALIYRQ